MNRYITQTKLEQVFLAIWDGNKPHHWQMISTMCFAYSLLFAGVDAEKFTQCNFLAEIANLHTQDKSTENVKLKDAA